MLEFQDCCVSTDCMYGESNSDTEKPNCIIIQPLKTEENFFRYDIDNCKLPLCSMLHLSISLYTNKSGSVFAGKTNISQNHLYIES